MTARPFDRLPLLCATALLAFTSASAQEVAPLSNGQRITPNFKDANISTIIEAVSEATGKNFIVDPRVNAQVTMFSRTPMSPEAFYEAFLAILQVHGFVAVPAGNVVKIVPDANARQLPANDLPSRVSGSSDEIVTQVIAVRNVSAAQLVPILRPLIPQYGHLAAYPASNILIISDRAANVNRIVRIIGRIDQEGDADVEVVPLQNASAAEVVRIVTSLYQAQAAAEGGGASPLRLVADDRSNSVLVSGDSGQRLRIKALIAHLDTPLEAGGDTQVRYLNYADAEKIAAKLKEQVTGIAQAAQPAGAQGAAPAGAAAADRSTTIWADAETNALVVTAQPKVMRQLMAVVDKLDIRRAQVLVEAIIVEVGENSNAELGVNWAVFSNEDDTRIPAGAFLNPVGGVTLADLARAVDNPLGTVNPSLASGTTIGIGRITDTGVNFAAMLRAIRGDANTNVLATPSAVTMDNQEAELKVAQEVPFVTGQFTTTGTATTDGTVNPFQTIQRQEVGTILKVTPQINEGDSVMLKIELESSSLATSSQGAVDLITNKRTITTHVLVEDGGVVVLGGLISNEARREEQRVPFLGRIPLIGLAFKTRTAASQRTNLMVFIRPKILRDGVQTTIETNQKYNYMREEQRKARGFELVPLLPRTDKPELPPPPPPREPAATPPPKEDGADSASQKPTEPADTPAPTTPPEGDQR
ncbi:MAG: type II secretion system secretin GspD [Steroidobacteraceae bacterium]